MKVSWNASIRLRLFQKRIEDTISDDEKYILSEGEVHEINDIMRELRPTILSEAQEVTAFFPREKRYPINALYGDLPLIFGADVVLCLPANAVADLEEACKCIVLERPTAAAFHLMRGTETVLKHLYFSVVKRGRHNPAMWANMVTHLNQRKALDEATRGMLDVFRRGFRNPTAHPDRFYNIDEAQDLLGTTCQLVGLIVSQRGWLLPLAPAAQNVVSGGCGGAGVLVMFLHGEPLEA